MEQVFGIVTVVHPEIGCRLDNRVHGGLNIDDGCDARLVVNGECIAGPSYHDRVDSNISYSTLNDGHQLSIYLPTRTALVLEKI